MSADILVSESPTVSREAPSRIHGVLDELAAIRAAQDEYEQPSMVRCGFVAPFDERDASDPYWRRFVRPEEAS